MATSSTGISSGTGVVSGIDYDTLITKLKTIQKRPITLLENKDTELTKVQTALSSLEASLYAIKTYSTNLSKDDLFGGTSISSSGASISASITGTPATGSYTVTALALAQGDSFLSDGISSSSTTLSAGSLSFRYGNSVDTTASLDSINGGEGFIAGKIKITDRSGTSASIDLSSAQSLDDVVTLINENDTIDITASLDGDHLVLTDTTGKTTSNLKVSEVNGGKTAASLGLANINVAAKTAEGSDLMSITADTDLSILNDGFGVAVNSILSDVQYTLADGTTGTIDFNKLSGSTVDKEVTIGDVLDTINAAGGGKLTAAIASDGKRIVLTDTTSGSGTFSLTALNDSEALKSLGLTNTAVGGVITGDRIATSASSVLLSSLNGGNGLGELGSITLTDRSGASATVDLSGAETFNDVIDAINAAGIGIAASVNSAGDGILLTDSTGSTTSSMIVASADSKKSAEALKIAVNQTSTTYDSGDLHLQSVGMNTLLSDLNGGEGISRGKFKITDSLGNSSTISLTSTGIKTVGDAIKSIQNQSSVKITVGLNETGDGIVITDVGGGSGTLTITDTTGTSAADLNLTGTAVSTTVGGVTEQVIDGAMTRTVTISADDTLQDLVSNINDLNAGITASLVSSGSKYYLSIGTDSTGKKSNLILDSSKSGISFSQSTQAKDALLRYGKDSSASSLVISSSTDTFDDIIDGTSIVLNSVSGSAVTLTISDDYSDVSSSISGMVSAFNTFWKSLTTNTEYNTDTNTAATLTGNTATTRIHQELLKFFSDSFSKNSSVTSLAQLGVSMKDDGTLEFDSDTFSNLMDTNAADIKDFFTNTTTTTTNDKGEETTNTVKGFGALFGDLIEELAGSSDSLLSTKIDAITTTIDKNKEKIDRLNTMLTSWESRMYTRFTFLETLISKYQNNATYLDSLAWITNSSSSSSSSS